MKQTIQIKDQRQARFYGGAWGC